MLGQLKKIFSKPIPSGNGFVRDFNLKKENYDYQKVVCKR